MAYSIVPYVDVGTQITDTWLDTYVKANLDVLGAHTHTGATGYGSSGLDNIDTITCDHQGSDPSAPASGHGTLYVKSGGVFIIQAGGSAVQVSEA
jgi:hypothetical protein